MVLECLLVPRKENLTGVSTGSTGRSKNLDPTGNPTGRSTRPVSISDSRSGIFDEERFLLNEIVLCRINSKHFAIK